MRYGCCGLLLLAMSFLLAAQEKHVPPAPLLKVQSYVLMDYHSGQILASSNHDLPVEPASLTKMMTMYVLEDDMKSGRVRFDDKVQISAKARHAPGSRMYLEQETFVPISELMKGVIIQSGNDASIAIAEYLAGDEETFAQVMNVQAKKLNMNNTFFKNATGLPQKDHRSTAYDLALLSRSLIKDYPESYALYAEKKFKFNNIEQLNRNRLLWENPHVDGLKTGFTDTAGYCLASSAIKDQTRLIAVVMGAESDKARFSETVRLLSYGFRFFETYKMTPQDNFLSKERVWFGDKRIVSLELKDDIYVTIPSQSQDKLRSELVVQKNLIAPITPDKSVGTLRIYFDKELLKEVPVYPQEQVKPCGWLTRAFEKAAYFF